MFAVSGHPSHSIIHDASNANAPRAAVNSGIIQNYLNEFQRQAVDGVIYSAVPDHMKNRHLMGGETPMANPTPSLLSTKASPTHASPGHVYYPGSSAKYN
jgi:hypothetical protein